MRLIFLGAPGAGKGTQAQILADKHNIPKLSTGDMFREAISSRSNLGLDLENLINNGNLVSDDIVIKIIENRLKRKDCKKGFILDGFPRTFPQAKALDNLLKLLNFDNFITFYLAMDETELVIRLSGRYACADCNRGYHRIYNRPKIDSICDSCASSNFIYRKDDDEESIKRRLQIYNDLTVPLINYYMNQNRLKKINAMNSIEMITQEIEKSLIKL